MARFKTYKIDKTPIDSLPEMVTISKKVKGEMFEKKFINIDRDRFILSKGQ